MKPRLQPVKFMSPRLTYNDYDMCEDLEHDQRVTIGCCSDPFQRLKITRVVLSTWESAAAL